MKFTFKEAASLARRARINGRDWTIRVGDRDVVLTLPYSGPDPRISCSDKMTFDGDQRVTVDDGRVTAKRSDGTHPASVNMWLFREVPLTTETIQSSLQDQVD